MHPFVAAWRNFEPNGAPYVLADDREALLGRQESFVFRDRAAYEAAVDSKSESRTTLHLGLLPQPFHGRIEDAAVYLIALNPGFSPQDYDWEENHSEFRQALLAEYGGNSPVLFTEPRFEGKHPGYDWWINKARLCDTIEALGNRAGIDRSLAQRFLAENVAILQLLPYHSRGFRWNAAMRQLHSVALAQSFVREYVLPKARRGECAVVVLWGNGCWQVEPESDRGIVVHGGINGKRLGPATAGGKLIVERLLARWHHLRNSRLATLGRADNLRDSLH